MAIKQINRLSPATVTVVTVAETVVLTSAPYYYDQPNPFVGGEHAGAGQGVSISGEMNISALGGSTTGATIRVRQGSIAGPVVGQPLTPRVVAADVTDTLFYETEDLTRYPAQAGGGIYVVTIQFTAAAGNATINEATMEIQGA